MAFHPLRLALYTALALFAITLIGLTAARINYTTNLRNPDPLHAGFNSYYDPVIVAILVTSITALLWSPLMMFVISRHASRGFVTSYAFELFGLLSLWTMYLVTTAISANKWSNLGSCRGFFRQCRILTAIQAFCWIAFATITFLVLASIADLVRGHSKITAPLAGVAGANAVTGRGSAGTGKGYISPDAEADEPGIGPTHGAITRGGYNSTPGTTGNTGGNIRGPETRNMGGAPPVSTGAPVSSYV